MAACRRHNMAILANRSGPGYSVILGGMRKPNLPTKMVGKDGNCTLGLRPMKNAAILAVFVVLVWCGTIGVLKLLDVWPEPAAVQARYRTTRLSPSCARIDMVVSPGLTADGEGWIKQEVERFLGEVRAKCVGRESDA